MVEHLPKSQDEQVPEPGRSEKAPGFDGSRAARLTAAVVAPHLPRGKRKGGSGRSSGATRWLA